MLSDPEKRKQYDAGGTFGGFGRGGGGAGGPRRLRGDFGDIFSTLFRRGGGPRGGPAADRGRDLETEVAGSLPPGDGGHRGRGHGAEAVDLRDLQRHRREAGDVPVTCPRCRGRGIDSESQGFFSISQPCPQCGGRGQMIENPCPTCGGSGLTMQRKRYRVRIPAGVRDGSRIRRRAARARTARAAARRATSTWSPGCALAGLPPARGRQPRGTVPITIAEAIRAATVEVPTLAARSGSGSRPGPSTGPSSGCAARARRSPTGAAATSSTGSRSRCRASSPRAARALERSPRRSTTTIPASGCCATRPRVGEGGRRTSAPRTTDRGGRRRGAGLDRRRGVFMISVAAELAEMHPQTLRMYEARGLITPKRSPKNTRLYSSRTSSACAGSSR